MRRYLFEFRWTIAKFLVALASVALGFLISPHMSDDDIAPLWPGQLAVGMFVVSLQFAFYTLILVALLFVAAQMTRAGYKNTRWDRLSFRENPFESSGPQNIVFCVSLILLCLGLGHGIKQALEHDTSVGFFTMSFGLGGCIGAFVSQWFFYKQMKPDDMPPETANLFE